MQTFLPYADYTATFEVLDYQRLGKQRVEAMQVLNCLRGISSMGWKNHPAVKMWVGYEDALSNYLRACIITWYRRGYNNNMTLPVYVDKPPMPPWFGDEWFHLSHRSNLLRKNPNHYGKLFGHVPPDLPYVWPN